MKLLSEKSMIIIFIWKKQRDEGAKRRGAIMTNSEHLDFVRFLRECKSDKRNRIEGGRQQPL